MFKKYSIATIFILCLFMQFTAVAENRCRYEWCNENEPLYEPYAQHCLLPCHAIFNYDGCVERKFCCNAYNDFLITLQNTGAESCRLLEYKMNGVLYKGELPLILPATAEEKSFVISEKRDSSVTLTYQCGESKMITIYMRQFEKSKHIHTSIEAKVIKSDGVFATYNFSVKSKETCGDHVNPGKIYWKLSN